MKIIKYILFSLLILSAASCANFKKISIDDVGASRVRKQSGSKVTVETKVKVNNPTGHQLVLRKINAEILRNGYQFADARLKEKVKIPAHSNDYHSVFIEYNLIDVMAVITGTVDLTQLDDSFTATGFVKGGTALFSKKLKFTDVPMSQFENALFNSAE